MPEIRNLPESFRVGLIKLLLLDNYTAEKLLTELSNVPPALYSSNSLSKKLATTTTISVDDTKDIVDTLYSLSMARLSAEVPISRFTDDIGDALKRELVNDDIDFSSDVRSQFEERFKSLLNLDLFKMGAKASNVLIEYEHVFNSARILTDIRPLFDEDVTNPPIGAIIVHTLKIEYQDAEGVKEFYVALDTGDVQVLTDVIQRAKSKEESVKSLLSSAQIYHIDIG